jgi:hypothetical protein
VVEHVTFNHGVEGSSPSALTKEIRHLQNLPEWQAATEALIFVAESKAGPTMLARIGVLRASNRKRRARV